jgi:hypothetical protein
MLGWRGSRIGHSSRSRPERPNPRGGAASLIAGVILVALWRLTYGVVDTLLLRSLNPLEHGVFQAALVRF